MPKQPFQTAYKGVILNCAPTGLATGRWAAHLIVTDQRGGGFVETVVPIAGGADGYETERQAADVALAVGQMWADDNA